MQRTMQQQMDREQASYDAQEPAHYWGDDPRRDDAEAEEDYLVLLPRTVVELPLLSPAEQFAERTGQRPPLSPVAQEVMNTFRAITADYEIRHEVVK